MVKKEGKPLMLSRWTSLILYCILRMQDNHLPKHWIVLIWFSHQKSKVQDIICEVETWEWKGDFFCILNSVLAHHCQGNDTAEIRSERVHRTNRCTCELPQLQATEHFLTHSATSLCYLKLTSETTAYERRNQGRLWAFLTSLFLNPWDISGNRPYKGRK